MHHVACEILVPWEGIRDLNHWTTQEWKECFLSGYRPALSARKEKCMWKSLSCVQLFGTPWTVQSMKLSRSEYIAFSRGSFQPRNQTQISRTARRFLIRWATREAQECWSGWPIPSPADLSNPGVKLGSPALQADSLPTELSGKP